jgi:putative kinase
MVQSNDMKWPTSINVTDHQVDISFLSVAQLNYYEALGNRLHQRYVENGRGRQIYTLSGPPGAGKSVITTLLQYYFSQFDDFSYINLGLDAFHYSNQYLEEVGLLSVKGRFDTYDTELLAEKLKAFIIGAELNLPVYSRISHEPISDQLPVNNRDTLALLEGQWLLYDEPAWEIIRAFTQYQIFVTGPASELRNNVIKRHVEGGRTLEESCQFYAQSDLINTDLVLKRRIEPDETLLFYRNIK